MSTRRRKDLAQRRRAKRRASARARRTGGQALQTLASLALALPGVAGNASAEGNDRYVSDYTFSLYNEDPIDSSKVTPGSETERFEIQSHQFRVAAPLGSRFDVGVDLTYETLSGATPWYVIPDTDGSPVQVMTGATIEEQRVDTAVNGNFYLDTGRIGSALGFSIEDDYQAFYGGASGERYFNEKNTTLSGGGGFSIDTIEPTDADSDPFRPSKEEKQTFSVYSGLSQVLARGTVVNSSLTYQHGSGYLSDPYKRVLVAGTPIGDSRPDSRNQITWLTRLRQHVDLLNAAFHADYRFYYDDWKITSHTIDAAWYQNLPWGLRLIPSLRYYSQSSAEFYAPWFDFAPASGHASSDYRLSPYGALAFRLRGESRFPIGSSDWRIHLGFERYMSSADLALGKVAVENPGLVSFNLLSVGLTARF